MNYKKAISEHAEQSLLIQWWRWQCSAYGIHEKLFYAIPNGGNRNAITGKVLKSEGVRSGIPDLFLAVARGGFHGLYIEMKKSHGGVLSDTQKEMLLLLKNQGFKTCVCHGFEEARKEILNYLK